MTDEDLRKTVADIRQASHDVDMVKSMLETAADKIERLQYELIWTKAIVHDYEQRDIDRLASSDAEPVAWLEAAAKVCDNYGREGDQSSKAYECETADELAARIRALKTVVAPRPDASEMLIEAANAIEGLLNEWDKFCKYGSPMARLANERVTHAREVLAKFSCS